MSLSDALSVAGIVLSTIGLLATVAGFWIAIIQLRNGNKQLKRTATAAEATKLAIEQANTRMIYNHLLVLLPQLTSLEADIDASMAANDRDAATRALVKFNHAANQIASLLQGQSTETDLTLAEDLRTVARSATTQKSALVSGSKKTVGLLLRTLSPEIADVAARCSALATTYQTKAA